MRPFFRMVFPFIFLAVSSVSDLTAADFWEGVRSFMKGTPQTAKGPEIKVLVAHNVEQVELEARGKYRLFDPHSGEHLSTRFVGKKRPITALRDGLEWGEAFPGVYQLQFVPGDSSARFFINGNEYRGSLFVYDLGGMLSVVNEVDVEEFLRGSLPVAYPEEMPQEVRAAIAIVARTAAYYEVAHPRNRYWAVSGELIGYRGRPIENSSASVIAFDRAVDATRSMVLSKTTAYEKKVTPFPAVWKGQPHRGEIGEESRISVAQAIELADQQKHAAHILSEAFPQATIQISSTKSQ